MLCIFFLPISRIRNKWSYWIHILEWIRFLDISIPRINGSVDWKHLRNNPPFNFTLHVMFIWYFLLWCLKAIPIYFHINRAFRNIQVMLPSKLRYLKEKLFLCQKLFDTLTRTIYMTRTCHLTRTRILRTFSAHARVFLVDFLKGFS